MIRRAGILVLRRGHISHVVKMHYLLLYTQALTRQSEGIVIITKGESTKILNFVTPEAGFGLFSVCCPIKNFSLIWRRHHYR